jgi:hypothetical protein
MSHDAIMALGLGFGDPSALDNVHFGWLTVPLMSSLGQYFKRFITTRPMFCSQRGGAMLFCMENLYSFSEMVSFRLNQSGTLFLIQMSIDIQHQ